MALPDDLSSDRDPGGEHPCRYCVHGYHLLVLSHGLRKASSGRRGPPTGFCGGSVAGCHGATRLKAGFRIRARREGGHAQPARSNGFIAARLTSAEKPPPPAQQVEGVTADAARPVVPGDEIDQQPVNRLHRCSRFVEDQPGHRSDALGHPSPARQAERLDVTRCRIQLRCAPSLSGCATCTGWTKRVKQTSSARRPLMSGQHLGAGSPHTPLRASWRGVSPRSRPGRREPPSPWWGCRCAPSRPPRRAARRARPGPAARRSPAGCPGRSGRG